MKFRTRYFILIMMLIILLISCSKSASKIKDKQFTPAKTDIVSNYGGIENLTRLKEFILNVNKGKEDKIRVVSFTKEGDPIISEVTYNLETLEVTNDSTRDEYGEIQLKHIIAKLLK